MRGEKKATLRTKRGIDKAVAKSRKEGKKKVTSVIATLDTLLRGTDYDPQRNR